MIDIDHTLRLLDVEAESNFVQAEAIDAINYLLREKARLHKQAEMNGRLLTENAELREENARLREALVAIAKIKNELYGPDWQEIEKARKIARAAIREGGKIKAEAACPKPDEAP